MIPRQSAKGSGAVYVEKTSLPRTKPKQSGSAVFAYQLAADVMGPNKLQTRSTAGRHTCCHCIRWKRM